MGVEVIKDSQGSERIVLENELLYNDENIENNLEGYEIIKILNEKKKEDDEELDNLRLNPNEKLNFTTKVVSKKNSKIYALKKICSDFIPDMEDCKENLPKYFEKINKTQNTTKYYTFFQEEDDIYIVYEFVDNMDLKGFLSTYTQGETKIPIEKELLWNIIIQCLYGLKCMHKNGILHKNIKLSNIFMTDNKIIKIGDFAFDFKLENYDEENNPYQSPELINDEDYKYDEKCDIYSMGYVFLLLCYNPFQEEEDAPAKVEEYYGSEIKELIDEMTKEDPESRPTAQELYKKILPKYRNNIAKLSSINSLFHCFYAFRNLSEKMTLKVNTFNEKTTPICYNYYNCCQAFLVKGEYDNYAEYLNNFRELFQENIQIDNDIEIKPKLILEFLLEKLNQETSSQNCRASFGIQKTESGNDKEKLIKKFLQNFKTNYDSIISDFFVGILKTKRTCKKCEEFLYSFNIFPFIQFNMEKCKGVKKIEQWFYKQTKQNHKIHLQDNVTCPKCRTSTEHDEYKQFYRLPQNLILSLNWEDTKPDNIDIPEKLDLSDKIVEDAESPMIFNLVGIIKKLKDEKDDEYYIAIYKDPNEVDKAWMVSRKKELEKCKDIKEYKGVPVLLFYSGKINIGE